jgi:hypothetical protein
MTGDSGNGGGRPVLEVEGLRKQYGATTSLRDVSLARSTSARCWRCWATTAPASRR